MTREKNLRAKWRPRHFAIGTGCRGHPCPRKFETHGGFQIKSSDLLSSRPLSMVPEDRHLPARKAPPRQRFAQLVSVVTHRRLLHLPVLAVVIQQVRRAATAV